MFLKSLSGRFLLLTIIFVMLAEVMIFVPSVARFRFDYLSERLERAQIASLTQLATPPGTMVDPELAKELLINAGVQSIALRRNEIRELALIMETPGMVEETFDLSSASAMTLMRDALRCLFITEPRLIRIVGVPVNSGGIQIEATLNEGPLKAAMVDYGQNIFALSLLISIITAALLFVAVRIFIVRPISRVVGSMAAFRDNPEDAHNIIVPDAGIEELRKAEEALGDMQSRIAASLKQKDRLAQLGAAVAKVSHDLRNMLTTATLLADRMEASADPAVTRTAPKLIASLDRAINLCEQTLTYGKAEEAEPVLAPFALHEVTDDVIDAEQLRDKGIVQVSADIPGDLVVTADREQLFRVLMNLARNARQAIENAGKPGQVRISARRQGSEVEIEVSDTGPGLPRKALDNLFKPFQGGTRREGSGLGLTIAAELVRGHGGSLELASTGAEGTCFRIVLPRAGDARGNGDRRKEQAAAE